MGLLPNSSRINTTIWMHLMDANKIRRVKARWELCKDDMSYLEQILEATPNGHLPPISKAFQIRQTRYGGHCWRSKDKLISDVLPCTF